MSNELTYMDCWHFIAPLIPVDTDYTMDIYVMVFGALKEAEKKRIAEKKKGRKSTHEKADWKQQHFQSAYLFVRQISFQLMLGLLQLEVRCTLQLFHKAYHLPTLPMRA